MLKTRIVMGMAVFFSLSPVVALASQDGWTCAGKQAAIETEIAHAQRANNAHRLIGLNKALQDVLTYCDNDDLEEKYQEKVDDKLDDVSEREEELAEAKYKGDRDKILKQENKLAEAKAELAEAQADLKAFYAELKSEK